MQKIFFNQLNDHKADLSNRKGVYKIINLINGKFYVGSTTKNFFSRFKCHLGYLRIGKHSCEHLLNAYLKYGEENFVFCVFKDLNNNVEIRKQEQRLLKRYIKQKICYNTSLDVFSFMQGRKHSIASRKKIAKSVRLRSKEIGEATRKRQLGTKHSKETIKKMQQSALKRDDRKRLTIIKSKKNRKTLSKSMRKLWKTEEHREKVRSSMRKVWENKEYKMKTIKAMQGKKRTKRQRNTYSVCKLGKTISFRKERKIILVTSLRHFSEKYKLNRGMLRLVMKGVKKSYKGWKLVSNRRKLCQTTMKSSQRKSSNLLLTKKCLLL